MYPSLETKLNRYDQLERMLQDPEISADPAKFLPLQREQGGLVRVARAMRRYHALKDDVATARMMVDEERDPRARESIKAELDHLQQELKASEVELEDLLTAGDSATRSSLIMEIRAGTGGDEAALFAGELRLRREAAFSLAELRGASRQVMAKRNNGNELVVRSSLRELATC